MADLVAEVANALYWDLAAPRYRVTAQVNHGLVTLQGIVDRAYQKSCAEATARRVTGVIGVRNEITLLPRCDWLSNRPSDQNREQV